MTLKKTFLHAKHLALKAKMAEFGGFDMPIQYSSVKDESFAVRNSCGVFDVSHMGEFWATGPEASHFVDYIMTNDFLNSEIGKAVYSPICREDGTIVDDLIAYKLKKDLVLICVNASNIQKDWEWISQFKNKFNFTLENKSESTSLLAVQGPQSASKLVKIGFNANILNELTYYGAIFATCNSAEFVLARTGYTGEDGFEIFGSHEDINRLWDSCLNNGIVPCGLAARDVLRTEVCYPLYGHEIHDENTPLDAGLKWTTKLQKPDFVGKQALLQYKPKTKLIKFSLSSGIPRPGYKIVNASNEEVGVVCSGTHSVALSLGIGLALVDIKKYIATEHNFVVIRDKKTEIKIHDKPFVSGGHK